VGKPDAVGSVSRRAFYFIVAALTTSLAVAEIIVPRPYGPFSLLFYGACGMLIANFLLSFYATDRFFKLRGLSRSGNSVETWDRIPASPKRSAADIKIVEHVVGRAEVLFTLVFSFLLCLLAVLGLLIAREPMTTIICGSGIVFLGRVWLQQSEALDGCYVRADRRGIFGYPARYALRRKLPPWSQIASCDIVTRHDPFGKPYLIMPVFKDQFGTKLMSLSLWSVPMETQERLVKYIKARLSKPRENLALD
jgi:hypothetical protein